MNMISKMVYRYTHTYLHTRHIQAAKPRIYDNKRILDTHIHTCIHTNTTYIHTYIYAYMHTCSSRKTYTCHTYIHLYTHTYTHTHT